MAYVISGLEGSHGAFTGSSGPSDVQENKGIPPEIAKLTFKMKQQGVENKRDVELFFWDFGGQVIFFSVTG